MINLSQETEFLARRLADTEGKIVDHAVRQALEARAIAAGVKLQPSGPHDRSPAAVAAPRARVDQIVHEIAALSVLDKRQMQEMIDGQSSTCQIPPHVRCMNTAIPYPHASNPIPPANTPRACTRVTTETEASTIAISSTLAVYSNP